MLSAEIIRPSTTAKITDIFQEGYYYHFVSPRTIDRNGNFVKLPCRIPSVLKYGLIAKQFANRIGILYQRNYEPEIIGSDIHWYDRDRWLYLFENNREVKPLLTKWQECLLIIIDGSLIVKKIEDMGKEWVKRAPEVYRHLRVSPKFFVGLGIDDINKGRGELNNRYNLQQEAKELSIRSTGTSLPVYGYSGALYYPHYQNYDSLRKIK